jgi:hypothetical protein
LHENWQEADQIEECFLKRIAAIISFVGLWMILAGADGLFAQRTVYTWTDERGVVHISNRKPKRDVQVQDVEHYNVPKGGRQEQKTPVEVSIVESTEKQKQIERYEKAALEAEEQARKARKIAEETTRAADEFRDQIGNRKKRWRKNRSRMKKLDEQARLAREQAQKANKDARSAREAVEALKRESQVKTDEKERP